MSKLTCWLAASTALFALGSTAGPRPLQFAGPGYPAPHDLSSDGSPVMQAWQAAIANISSYLSGNRSVGGFDLVDHTFSISAFSLRDPEAVKKLQFHYTSAAVRNSTQGTRQADGDSPYRVGSISKVFTVYATLAALGDAYWHRPVTDFIPQLKQAADRARSDPIDSVDWAAVTLGSLAGQMSGISRDLTEIGYLTPDPVAAGLPPLDYQDPLALACMAGDTTRCTEQAYLQEIIERPPIFAPWTTPMYSNLNYDLLAIALSNITSKSFTSLVADDLLAPLHLTSSGLGVPSGDRARRAVVVTNLTDWRPYSGWASGGGGFYSSSNDMARLAVSILNSTLLAPRLTREWLKPVAHTASLTESVGRPWEILRYTQPSSGRISDLYTKGGDVPNYDANLLISPDHQAGFVVLTAGPNNAGVQTVLADVMSDALLPAFEAAAIDEAKVKIAGVYRPADYPRLNSSLSLKVDPASGPGLLIDAWVSNGTDIMLPLSAIVGQRLDFRLYPTDLDMPAEACSNTTKGAVRRQAFRAAITYGKDNIIGPFSQSNADAQWTRVDLAQYAKRSLDSFVFEFDANATALSVLPSALRVILKKVA